MSYFNDNPIFQGSRHIQYIVVLHGTSISSKNIYNPVFSYDIPVIQLKNVNHGASLLPDKYIDNLIDYIDERNGTIESVCRFLTKGSPVWSVDKRFLLPPQLFGANIKDNDYLMSAIGIWKLTFSKNINGKCNMIKEKIIDYDYFKNYGNNGYGSFTWADILKLINNDIVLNRINKKYVSVLWYSCRGIDERYIPEYEDMNINFYSPNIATALEKPIITDQIIDEKSMDIEGTYTDLSTYKGRMLIFSMTPEIIKNTNNWRGALAKQTNKGCGYNVLSALSIIKQIDAREKITTCPLSGLSIWGIISNINNYLLQNIPNYQFKYTVLTFRLELGFNFLKDYFVNFNKSNGDREYKYVSTIIKMNRTNGTGHTVSVSNYDTIRIIDYQQHDATYIEDAFEKYNHHFSSLDIIFVYGDTPNLKYITDLPEINTDFAIQNYEAEVRKYSEKDAKRDVGGKIDTTKKKKGKKRKSSKIKNKSSKRKNNRKSYKIK